MQIQQPNSYFDHKNDFGYGLSLDVDGDIYLTGQSESSLFPTTNAYNSTNSGGFDVILLKISGGYGEPSPTTTSSSTISEETSTTGTSPGFTLNMLVIMGFFIILVKSRYRK